MYRQNYGKPEQQGQLVQFSTLRKNSVGTIKIDGQYIIFPNQPNIIVAILAGHSLLLLQGNIKDNQFPDFSYEQVPKHFQQFQHEKTINEIFTILKNRIKSIEHLVQFLNSYPITTFVLECWARQRTKNWIQTNINYEYMGNELQILNDLGAQIRGPLLGIIASCFGLIVKIHYQLLSKPFQAYDILDFDEQYGDNSAKQQLCIQHRADGLISAKLQQRDQEISVSQPTSKGSQCGYLRRSKMGQNQVEPRNGAQFKSVKKERNGQCQKCGPTKKCECNTIKRKGLGVTPKSNQLSNSSSVGFKSDPLNLGLGFLNANNISKIRDNRPK